MRWHAVRLPVLTFLAVIVLLPVGAHADGGSESAFVSDTNSARGSNGRAHYVVAGDLAGVAQRWAAHMAADRTLAHNPGYSSEVCCWTHLGENVGVGSSVEQIERAFMRSAPHRANILSSSYTQVGIGTARSSDGRLWVDELFRLPTYTASRAVRSRPPSGSATTRHVVPTSRGATRRPRRAMRPQVAARAAFLRRLASARQHTAAAYADPVGGAVAYLQVMREFAGSAGD